MIVKQRLSWARTVLALHGSSLTRTYPRIVAITAFSALVTFGEAYFDVEKYSLTLAPFTLIGVALGIFLGFRTNAAYDRYWEGRKLWGRLVNVTRTFARQAMTLVGPTPTVGPPGDDDEATPALRTMQRELVHRTIAYVHGVRHLLRGSDPFEELARFLPDAEIAALRTQRNVPLAILLDLGRRVRDCRRSGWLSEFHVPLLDGSLTDLTDVQGGCERIKLTPLPFGYTVLMHRIVAFYCFALPFGLVHDIGALTPVVVMLISHALLGLDEIGDEIEDPFGTEPQHLPLTAICRTIEINLRQTLGETDVPPPLTPVNGILD